MSYSSYKLSEFTSYEINIMIIGIHDYVIHRKLDTIQSFKLGVYSNDIVRNVALVQQTRRGIVHSKEVLDANYKFMDTLNLYEGLIDHMINYLYDSFNKLPVNKQYDILRREFVPNLEKQANIHII